MEKMILRNIRKERHFNKLGTRFLLTGIFCALLCGLFCSCGYEGADSNGTESVEDKAQNNEWVCELSGRVGTVYGVDFEGALPSSSYSSLDRSTGIAQTASSPSVQAKNTDGTVISGNVSGASFAIKVNKIGTWTITASGTIGSNSYSGSETIVLTEEDWYKDDILITMYPTGTVSAGAGTTAINLSFTVESGLPVKSAKMTIKNDAITSSTKDIPATYDSSTGTGSFNADSSDSNFSTLGTSFAGSNTACITFYSDSNCLSPVYTCCENVYIVSGRTTDSWVISSANVVNQDSSDVMLGTNKKAGPLQIASDGSTIFKLTKELVDSSRTDFYVDSSVTEDSVFPNTGTIEKPFKTMKQAVEAVLGHNDGTSLYTIWLMKDISINSSNFMLSTKAINLDATNGAGQNLDKPLRLRFASYSATEPNTAQYKIRIQSSGTGIWAESNNADRKINLIIDGITITGANARGVGLVGNVEMVMERGSINGNSVSSNQDGGGISIAGYADSNEKGPTFIMNGGEINENRADTGYGGGVGIGKNSTFIMNGGVINKNSAKQGGGVASGGEKGGQTFIMNGGIIGNYETVSGKQVPAKPASFGNANVGGNVGTENCGGLYILGASGNTSVAKLNGGTICGNSANTTFNHGAGGIYVQRDSVIDICGTDIIYNHSSYRGGGVYSFINGGTTEINFYKGRISGNSAQYDGGGVYLYNSGGSKITFNMYGGSIDNNTAAGGGDGIGNYATNNPTFVNIYGGSIYDNKSSSGYGIYLPSTFGRIKIYGGFFNNNDKMYCNAGTFEMQGAPHLYGTTIEIGSQLTGGISFLKVSAPLSTIYGGEILATVQFENTVASGTQVFGVYSGGSIADYLPFFIFTNSSHAPVTISSTGTTP